MKIDVCIPAKKYNMYQEDLVFSWLTEIGIPVNNVFVCDVKGLANARNKLMQRVETKWFLFLDDDIKINKDWWKEIKKHTKNPKVGAINGLPISDSWILNLLRSILLLRGIKYQRGFTSNTLIRRKAVEGIMLKRQGRLEDLELQEKIKANGYEWKFVRAYCKHTKKGNVLWKDSWSDFKILCKEKGLVKALMMI